MFLWLSLVWAMVVGFENISSWMSFGSLNVSIAPYSLHRDHAGFDGRSVRDYAPRASAETYSKSSDYKVSPFELESVLIEHPAVVEAAVVPQPDETRLSVPKAYVALAQGWAADADTARAIMEHALARDHLAPYLKARRVESFELPKTISGKIRARRTTQSRG